MMEKNIAEDHEINCEKKKPIQTPDPLLDSYDQRIVRESLYIYIILDYITCKK